ncbi:MAG: hypothetical protein IJP71_00760 [Lachnospiraceae bacterium]|nr:hypothetical protein [Lachnospiraceae bacterium]
MKPTKQQKTVIINALNHYKEHLEKCSDELSKYGKDMLETCKSTLRAIENNVIL